MRSRSWQSLGRGGTGILARALPVTYHLGPGLPRHGWRSISTGPRKPVYTVIATIPGAVNRDEWIIYGNHHDAWVNGAHDPGSGAAAVLETARTLSELVRLGWEPRRTIHLALWDAEEFGLIGSTEWVEKHEAELGAKAVLYLNSDTNGKGKLRAGGSPSLEKYFSEIARDNGVPFDEKLRLTPVGAGSDYVAFLHHAGIASVNAGFGGGNPPGVYHSIYDSFHWYSNFSDGDFSNGKNWYR
ncbi:MAG: M28 family peptidase [Bryobacteraceae bacterium]